MDPIQIVFIVVGVAAIWAIVELALVLRKTRSTVASLDKTVADINAAIDETKPVITKLDDTLDTLQPALEQVEPLIKQGNIAVEALTADLIEVNGVLRDVSQITGGVSSASDAVSSLADAASDKVQKLFGKNRGAAPSPERTLHEPDRPLEDSGEHDADIDGEDTHETCATSYYTYGADDGMSSEMGKSEHE